SYPLMSTAPAMAGEVLIPPSFIWWGIIMPGIEYSGFPIQPLAAAPRFPLIIIHSIPTIFGLMDGLSARSMIKSQESPFLIQKKAHLIHWFIPLTLLIFITLTATLNSIIKMRWNIKGQGFLNMKSHILGMGCLMIS